ncbi:MAG: hypothetical protein KGI26_04015 [Thaumarchaeota archaeon]|nr:hypothetical protein [Nitrososphaerota archaeon]
MTSSRAVTVAVFVVVFISFALRAYPYVSSGVPYHTDTYPQLANVRNLVANSPVPLSPGNGFDSYNILWPADTLFYAVSSVLLGGVPIAVMPLLGPLAASTAALLFYALLRSFDIEWRASLVGTLLFAVAGGTVMISTGVTKEAFAIPLLFLTVLLMNGWLRRGSRAGLALSVGAFGALLAAHSLGSVVGLLLCSYLAFAYIVSPGRPGRRVAVTVGVLALFSAMSYLYFYVYAVSSLPYDLQPSDLVAVFGYEALLTAPVWLSAAFRLGLRRWTGAWIGAIALAVGVLFASAVAYHPLLDSPVASPYVLALLVPYVAVAFLAAFGISRAKQGASLTGPVFAAVWTLGMLGIVAFSAFGTPGAVGTTLRIFDFVYPGVAVLGGLALSGVMASGKLGGGVGALALGALVVASAFVVPYSAYWSGPLGGSQRVYTQAEVAALSWTGSAPANASVYADARYVYLASYYTGRAIDLGGGYLFLAGISNFTGGCLILDGLVAQIGYVGGTYGLPVNMTLVRGLPAWPSLGTVYSDGSVTTFCRP